jgi:hypothetical protein
MRYVLYPSFNGWAFTTEENYKQRILDANKITRFSKSAFDTKDDVINWLVENYDIPANNIIYKEW